MQGTDGHSHTQGKGFPSCSQLGSHSAPGPQILVPLGPDSLMGKDPRTLWSWTASSSLTCDAAWSSDAVFPLRNHSSQVLRTMRTAELSRDFDFDFVCFWFWIHMSVPYMHIWVCVLMSVGTCVYKGACFHRCLCTHVKAWGCHQVLSSVSPPPPPSILKQGLSLNPKRTEEAVWLASFSALHTLGSQVAAMPTWLLCGSEDLNSGPDVL